MPSEDKDKGITKRNGKGTRNHLMKHFTECISYHTYDKVVLNGDSISFKPIDISDKELFDSYLRQYRLLASELTFTNLFMWRRFYNFRYSITEGYLCIIAKPLCGEPYALFPIEPQISTSYSNGKDLILKNLILKNVILKLNEYFTGINKPLLFRKITSDELKILLDLVSAGSSDIFFKSTPSYSLDRDNSDYLYLSSDLIKLEGKKYDGKRNHIRRFKQNTEFSYEPISSELIRECERIMSEWCAERNCTDHNELFCEREANMELLSNYEALGCKGALIRVNGRFEAFTVGEMLNTDTAVIHIEKAKSGINGLFTFINQQFCEHEWSDARYINREQDLGMEGLRRAKLSYHPVSIIDKYNVRYE